MNNSDFILAFKELEKIGIKARWKPEGMTYGLSRTPIGEWFVCSKNGYHEENERQYIDLDCCPSLKGQLKLLMEYDHSLRVSGGRVFVSRLAVFRKNAY